MKRQVEFSQTAEFKLDKLFKYLEENWSKKVKLDFITKLEEKLKIIQQKPEAFPKSEIKKGLHKIVITKQNTLYYSYDEDYIYVITIFDNRQDFNKLLKEVR